VATGDLQATVDPLAVDDLTPLWDALVGGPTLVVHAGAHDLDIVHRHCGRLPTDVFDTQVAGGFLGKGDSTGYGNLVGAVLKQRVRGGEGYTDWSRRPLTDDQVDYALEDVRYLLALWGSLSADLEDRGRMQWAQEETARRFASIGDPVDPYETWRRVKDARKLRGKALAVLREITAWREERAVARDETRQRIVPDRVLIEVARRSLTDPGRIARLRGLHPGQAKAVAGPLADAVRRAEQVSKSDWPRWPAPPPSASDPRVDVFASLLHAVVRARAADLDLAPRLLGTRGDLEEFARRAIAGEAMDGVTLLDGWRRTAVGEELLAVLKGETAVRIVDRGAGPHLDVG
jgi:ribonuclease D